MTTSARMKSMPAVTMGSNEMVVWLGLQDAYELEEVSRNVKSGFDEIVRASTNCLRNTRNPPFGLMGSELKIRRWGEKCMWGKWGLWFESYDQTSSRIGRNPFSPKDFMTFLSK